MTLTYQFCVLQETAFIKACQALMYLIAIVTLARLTDAHQLWRIRHAEHGRRTVLIRPSQSQAKKNWDCGVLMCCVVAAACWNIQRILDCGMLLTYQNL